MNKVQIDKNFSLPMPVVIVGTKLGERVNFMTVGWISRVNSNPPMLGIGINKAHLTNAYIRESRKFSVNFPDSKMIKETDYCGIISGRNKDKSEVFKYSTGTLGVPVINACPVSLECFVEEIVELPTNTFFIGEIKEVWAENTVLKKNRVDFDIAELFLLTMPDNKYRSMTHSIGKAWDPQNRELDK